MGEKHVLPETTHLHSKPAVHTCDPIGENVPPPKKEILGIRLAHMSPGLIVKNAKAVRLNALMMDEQVSPALAV